MIYLDNAATTFPSEAALRAFLEEARAGANPSSLHRAGFDAHTRLESYRRVIASVLGADAGEVYFTSGGTESANLALLGAAHARARRANKILVSDAEHPCVSECVKALGEEGFSVVSIPTRGGVLDLSAVENAADETVCLAAFMHVNNETGAVFSVADAFGIVHRSCPHALCFCDCVQSFGHVPFTARALGADLLSLSAHKISGVRGVGALYVKKGVRLVPPTRGGGQERGLRSGTENAPGIAAFAAATREMQEQFDTRQERLLSLQKRLSEGLEALGGVEILSGFERSPHIVSAAFAGYKSEVLLHLFSDAGVCVSAGSACSSKKGSKSPILLAHGLDARHADATLRFSLSHQTTEEEISAALSAANTILEKGRYRR